jgi:Protein of unknown function (DUF3501)
MPSVERARMAGGNPMMKKIDASEILDLTAYERMRPRYVQEMIEHKRPRRVHVGEDLCFVFENRRTVLFQIQEMTRAERTVDPAAIAAEIEVYNELVPDANALSATLMIEIPDRTRIRGELDRLIGIDEHVFLDVGGDTVQATFDPKQFEEDRISAVQYVRFPLGPTLAQRFLDPEVPVELRVDHPNYSNKTRLEGEVRRALMADLTPD